MITANRNATGWHLFLIGLAHRDRTLIEMGMERMAAESQSANPQAEQQT